jgi:imidazole glycerol-phosphate synthase subunit HisH
VSVAIVDLAYGNIGSIEIALKRLGAETIRTADPATIRAAERVVLPGVGAAGYAMGRIDALGLRDTLTTFTKPLLGICLGMQLLFEESEEDNTACLGLIPGKVRKLDPAPNRPVPHMGWSRLETRPDAPGLATGDYVYFAHSFACDDGPHSIAVTDYGRPVAAAVRRENVLGAQFHPERSSAAGARFLKAFLSS